MKKIFFFFLFLFFNLPYSSKSYSEESISKYQSLNEKNIINFIDEIPFIEEECFGNDIDTNNLDWLAQIQNLELNMNLGCEKTNMIGKTLNFHLDTSRLVRLIYKLHSKKEISRTSMKR